jgi:hypothetical protein
MSRINNKNKKKMETTRTVTGNGSVISNNYMLDDIIDAFEKAGLNDGSTDDLIKELAIQKIEHGRRCMGQLVAKSSGQTRQSIEAVFVQMDIEQKKKIFELNGKPIDRTNNSSEGLNSKIEII